MRVSLPILMLSACLLPIGTVAQMTKETSKEPHALSAPVDPALIKPLPDLPGVVPWKTLAAVEQIKEKEKVVPKFDRAVLALDKKEIKLQGFMMPLEAGERQKHFILTSLPPSCGFCMPGGAESVVEVRSKQPIKYTMEPVVLAGKLAVLKDDPTGLYYRLIDATAAKPGK